MEAQTVRILQGKPGWRELFGRALCLFPVHVCNCCGKKTWRWTELIPHTVGIQRDAKDRPALVLWNCPRCKSTKAVAYGMAPRALRLAAWEIVLPEPPIFVLIDRAARSKAACN